MAPGVPQRAAAKRGQAGAEPSPPEAVEVGAAFEAPSPQPLETIFESEENEAGVVRKRGQRHLLEVGKYLARRAIHPPNYWLEDQEKARHRKRMANRAFKGQRKLRLVALTDAQEELLQRVMAHESPASADEDELESPAVSNQPFSPRPLPTRLFGSPKPPSGGAYFSPATTPLGHSERKRPHRRRSSLFRRGLALDNVSESPMDEDTDEPRLGPAPSHNMVMPPASPGLPASALKPPEQPGVVLPNEEIRRQIEEADSFFGAIAGTETPSKAIPDGPMALGGNRKNGRRATISVKVRRSSRLFKSADPHQESMGTVFQMAEIVEHPRGRRKSRGLAAPALPEPPPLTCVGDLEMTASHPMPMPAWAKCPH